MNKLSSKVIASNAEASQSLRKQASAAIWSMAIAGVGATLIAGVIAIWMTTMKIARPLARMIERMKALAKGDHGIEIDGVDRRDEIGEMAGAVQVFKTNAIQRVQAEKEAAEHRSEAEAQRGRVEGEKARAAEVQSKAMASLGDGLQRLAGGDLTTRLDSDFPSEFAKIRDDFNAAAEKLMGTLSASSRPPARSTPERKAFRARQTTFPSALSNRLQAWRRPRRRSRDHRDCKVCGRRRAREPGGRQRGRRRKNGAVIVKQAIEAMDEIAKSSEQIGQIIGVIDEIAFQTNLLALNAGVEAARAGDAGKGLRSSPPKCARSPSARRKQPRRSRRSFRLRRRRSAGVKLVADLGKALERIIGQVSEINRVVADIASGAQEQSTGLQQVNTAITLMDSSTQQNAAMVGNWRPRARRCPRRPPN